jgi:hypothetical protein
MDAAEALGVLQRARRRRRVGERPQPGAGAVGADVLEVIKKRPADQLAFRQRDDQLARRQAAAADLDRPRTALENKLRVDQLRQPDPPRQLAADRQPRLRRQAGIVGAHHDPSGSPVTVNSRHPLGDLHPPPMAALINRHDPAPAGRKAPQLRGFPALNRHQSTSPAAEAAPTASTYSLMQD